MMRSAKALLLAAFTSALILCINAALSQRTAAPEPSRMLLIIQGQYRTLDLTLDSILRNLCAANGGCDVALSLANDASAVSAEVARKLAPYLVAAYYAEPGDLHSPQYIYEYEQTLKVLTRLPALAERYTHVMRVRADCYVSQPMPLMSALGAGPHFERDWAAFGAAHRGLQAWFFTGGIPQLRHKLIAQQPPPPMAWSPLNSLEFNPQLLASIAHAPVSQATVRALVEKHHIMYISGGLFVHFGRTADMLSVTRTAFEHWRTGPGKVLNWATQFFDNDKALAWREPVAQEAHIRLAHHFLGYSLIDLHNAADYLVSFSWKHYGYSDLTQARGLLAWLLRPRQVRFKSVRGLRDTEFWRAIDNESYVNSDVHPSGRPLIMRLGCLRESAPQDTVHCFQQEEDQ